MNKVILLLCLLGVVKVVFGQGECSATVLCANNYCCSKWGYCGLADNYCGDGCQSGPCHNTGTGTGTTGTGTGTGTTGTGTGTGTGPNPNWPGGPLKALYVDSNLNWNTPSVTFKAVIDAGYNLVILAFMVNGKAVDAAGLWGGMSDGDKQSTIQYAHDHNARIIVSTGGATETPYNSFSGNQYGSNVANWAKQNHLDGVDFDLENFGSGFRAGSMNTDQSIGWVADATNAARNILGGDAVITHAPQPPYFGANAGYADGYTQVYKRAPSINYLLVQYYNNGPATTYETIFQKSNGGAVLEIASYGIPLYKIVVGKPVNSNDAGSQWMSASDIRNVFNQAAGAGWKSGIMGWQWHDSATNSNWVRTIFP